MTKRINFTVIAGFRWKRSVYFS